MSDNTITFWMKEHDGIEKHWRQRPKGFATLEVKRAGNFESIERVADTGYPSTGRRWVRRAKGARPGYALWVRRAKPQVFEDEKGEE